MANIKDAIRAEEIGVIRKRRKPGSFDRRGNAVPGQVTQATIKAVIQPVTGSDLLDLPEGVRASASYALWSLADIQLDDVIVNAGENLRVTHLWPRPVHGFNKAATRRTKNG